MTLANFFFWSLLSMVNVSKTGHLLGIQTRFLTTAVRQSPSVSWTDAMCSCQPSMRSFQIKTPKRDIKGGKHMFLFSVWQKSYSFCLVINLTKWRTFYLSSVMYSVNFMFLCCVSFPSLYRGELWEKRKREKDGKKKNWRETWKSKKKKKLETGEGGGVWNEWESRNETGVGGIKEKRQNKVSEPGRKRIKERKKEEKG